MSSEVEQKAATFLKSREESASIARMLLAESFLVVAIAVIGMGVWDLHTGVSILIGAGAYLFPYGIAYIVFFGFIPASRHILLSAVHAQRKKLAAGGFVLAELLKLAMTVGILGAAMIGYSQANWLAILMAFGFSIVCNMFGLWWALQSNEKETHS